MSVQFGRWNIDGQPVDPCYLQKTKEMLAPYGPDGEGIHIKDGVGILYRAFHTTRESRKETQPLITPSGSILCWDGRLDNRDELWGELGKPLTASASDLDIVAMAYEAHRTGCFSKFIGDWALSVWEPKTRSVVLAKDPIGTRHLYYSFDDNQITWSTILDPLVLLAGRTFALEEEYIAGWLSFFPATHLTPYVGIHSVPPSCFIRLEPERQTIKKYWDFDPSKTILYKTDSEYEKHFRQVFGEAVRRRLRSDRPVLAELSGGMDSSSIVCMADELLSRESGGAVHLHTLSYYDETEPNWNELPYVSKVEQRRGRAGYHIDLSGELEYFHSRAGNDSVGMTPNSAQSNSRISRRFSDCLASCECRIVLSGVGGDEVMGGVPTPLPELAEILASLQLRHLAERLKAWALAKKVPWMRLLSETIRAFLPSTFLPIPSHRRPAPWLQTSFVRRHKSALCGYEKRLRVFGSRASFQENVSTLDGLRRQIGCSVRARCPRYEVRCPYLDRDLLEYLFAIPREQLVRPGQRRSLMRRALAGIVPQEILDRKRKAYVVRSPTAAVSTEWGALAELRRDMTTSAIGIIAREEFESALNAMRQGQPVALAPLLRAVTIERWLRGVASLGILSDAQLGPSQRPPSACLLRSQLRQPEAERR